ncbi:MAG: hypothetical protein WCR27_02525 [Eubacteriales bacterium]
MGINNELAVLYSKFLKQGEHFVVGGVIDEKIYLSSRVKLMILFKEIYDPNKIGQWSLVDYVNDQILNENFTYAWGSVGMWGFGAENGYVYFDMVNRTESIKNGLKTIAATSLKKYGGYVRKYELVKEHARENIELWTKEIEIIKPDIVVCAGTYPVVQDILGFESSECKSGVNYGKALNTMFMDFHHPADFANPRLLYAYFKETMLSLGYR